MNYEERYKEAIYLLKELRPKISDYYREKLDGLFPEIAESEDERTRKELMDFVIGNSIGNSEKCEKYLAWLEKQGEQNLANSAKICKEDEEMFDMTEINLRELRDRFSEKYSRVGECIAWLKSLKERFGCEVNCTTKKSEE